MKKISIFAITMIVVQAIISSCSPSSTTTTKPGSWDKAGDFNGKTRSGAVGFMINGVQYIGAGYNAGLNIRLIDFWKYDAASDSWSQVADFPGVARTNAVAFVIGGKAYVGTGYDDNANVLSDFWKYDPTAGSGGTWSRVADFGYSAANSTPALIRYGATGFSVNDGTNDRGFVCGGQDKSQTGYKDFWEYDAVNDQWISRQSMGGSKRWNAFVMIINNIAYIGGGQDNNYYPTDFWKFDVTKLDSGNPWTALDALDQRDVAGNAQTEPKPRELAATFAIGKYGYIVAGATGFQLGDTWQYDPSTDNWLEYYSLNSEAQSRATAIGFGVGAKGYIATGVNGSTRLDDVWIFDPVGTEPNYK
jgi:N-acetylneuraminic acid mutarotase